MKIYSTKAFSPQVLTFNRMPTYGYIFISSAEYKKDVYDRKKYSTQTYDYIHNLIKRK